MDHNFFVNENACACVRVCVPHSLRRHLPDVTLSLHSRAHSRKRSTAGNHKFPRWKRTEKLERGTSTDLSLVLTHTRSHSLTRFFFLSLPSFFRFAQNVTKARRRRKKKNRSFLVQASFARSLPFSFIHSKSKKSKQREKG